MQDVKIILNEKTAFTKLEEVWNQEEDKKKKEEEELAAKRKAEMANNTDPLYVKVTRFPFDPSIYHMAMGLCVFSQNFYQLNSQ